MKYLILILCAFSLASCEDSNPEIVKEGIVEFIHFQTGPSSSTFLTHEKYEGIKYPATFTHKWRSPKIILNNSYIEISYPDTDHPVEVIPRESLIRLRWNNEVVK